MLAKEPLDDNFRKGFARSVKKWAVRHAESRTDEQWFSGRSAIESVMAMALSMLPATYPELREEGYVRFAPTYGKTGATLDDAMLCQENNWGIANIHIWQEINIGPYRADFLVLVPLSNNNDKRIAGIVVECDGHASHHGTKDRIERDHKRDAYMQERRFIVLRFTGRQIYQDCMECAEKVIRLAIALYESDANGNEVQSIGTCTMPGWGPHSAEDTARAVKLVETREGSR